MLNPNKKRSGYVSQNGAVSVYGHDPVTVRAGAPVGAPRADQGAEKHGASLRLSIAIDLGPQYPERMRYPQITAEAHMTLLGSVDGDRLYEMTEERLSMFMRRLTALAKKIASGADDEGGNGQ